jgi:prepilin-type N-terminal cleavage/methylation domain-containing protein
MSNAVRRRAFTLVELLVVLAIIAALTGLVLPAVQRVREAANRVRCANHLKQLILAVLHHHDTLRSLPPSRRDPGGTWLVYVLPFVDQGPLAAQWDLERSFYVQSAAARETAVPVFFCPSRRSASDNLLSIDGSDADGKDEGAFAAGAVADYAVSAGDPSGHADYWWTPSPAYPRPPTNGAFIMLNDWDRTSPMRGQSRRRTLAMVKDGTSHTLFLGEKHVPADQPGHWPWDGAAYNGDYASSMRQAGVGAPLVGDRRDPAFAFGGAHPGVGQFAFGDGSVRAVPVGTDPVLLGRLANIADGQPVDGY